MEFSLVNPGRKVRKMKRRRKHHRSAAQRAATRRMLAANRSRRGYHRNDPGPNPRKRRSRRRSSFKSNPMRSVTFHGRPASRRRFRRSGFRRNPIGTRVGLRQMARDTLMPGVIGGVGAVGLDFLLQKLPLPAALQSRTMAPIVKFAGAIGLGLVVGMLTKNRRMGESVAAGGIAVTAYDLIKSFMPQPVLVLPAAPVAPSGALSEFVSPAQQIPDMGEYVGEYVSEAQYVY